MAKKQTDPAAQPQAAQQQAEHAQQLRSAGVNDPRHLAAVHAAVARGVRIDTILDALRRAGPSVMDLVEELVHAFGGDQPAARHP